MTSDTGQRIGPARHWRHETTQLPLHARHPFHSCLAHVMRVPAFTAVLLLGLLMPWTSDAQTPLASARLHEAMAAQLRAQGLEGAVWSTVAEGTIATGAAGIADARTGQALRADARVHVGSVAKTLLATGVLRLVTERRLALETPVSQLLPGMIFDNPWSSSHPVLVRHLLDHTAGLDDARFSQVFSLQPNADTPLADAFRGRGPLRVRSRPGSRHSYSNTGFTLLGMVIEAVTGARYETYLETHLLRPLGMHDSTFAFTTQDGPHADPRLAMGHFEDGKRQAAVPTYVRPATQFTTTAADMGRFASFLMGDGSVHGRPFVDSTLLAAMGRASTTEAAVAGLRVGYGLGMALRDRHGAVGKCHGGSTVGYRAMLCLFPEQQRAFFVAHNADHETADYGRFDRLLIEALRVQAPAARQPEATRVDTRAWEGYYVPSPNRFASLAWLDTTLNFLRVARDGSGLRLEPFQSEDVALTPAGGALFRAKDRVIASHAFVATPEGRRAISTGTQNYEQVSLSRLMPLWISLVAGLLGLAWLLVAGIVRLVALRRAAWSHPAIVPFFGVAALLLPLPLFLQQSFLQLGDLTPASGLLAAVTGLLPVAMLAGLALMLPRRPWRALAWIDVVSMLAVLQFAAVLAGWGLMPLRMWS